MMTQDPYKQSKCMLPLPSLLASVDGRSVADDIGQQMIVSLPYMLPSSTLLSSADSRIIADDIEQHIIQALTTDF